jgi:hypothetical protein
MSIIIDMKYALRLLFKAPKFTTMTLGVLIGGLSISLYTFSFLYSMVYKPLPLPEGDTAKSIGVEYDGNLNLISGYEYQNLKGSLTSLAEFGVYDNRDVRISVEESGKNVSGSLVQQGFFEFSRTSPILGRTIQAEDSKPGAIPVAVISYDVWQSELNGNESVLTSTMMLNGEITEIIGVMPKGYRFPNTSKIWLPLAESVFNTSAKTSEIFYAYGRVKENSSIEAAEKEVTQSLNQI